MTQLNFSDKKVVVIGAGLAGSEVAYFLARQGISVVLYESKRVIKNPSQKSEDFAELVCTNSLKSVSSETPHGLLKSEMTTLGSLILKVGEETRVPAGEALAVDRKKFSGRITELLSDHPLIEIIHEEVTDPEGLKEKHKSDYVVMASGPLTTDSLSNWIKGKISGEDFFFYDAIAPVVDADTLDYSKLYFKDRHSDDLENADYLNAPMNKEEYETFVRELVNARKVPAKNFEDYKFFESCLPIDTMAERGVDTPRFSCMKPIGLELEGERRPYAVVQLRKENLLGSAYNLVGFQTKLTYPEQQRVFRMIPGLENAEFLHLGSIHRNSFLNARTLLNPDMSSITYPWLYFAGQMTGVEGYTESAASGLYVGFNILRKLRGEDFQSWPVETAIGALVNYIMTVPKPTPSNINTGLFPPVTLTKEERKRRKEKKKIKRAHVARRAKEFLSEFLKDKL